MTVPLQMISNDHDYVSKISKTSTKSSGKFCVSIHVNTLLVVINSVLLLKRCLRLFENIAFNKPAIHQTVIHDRTAPVESEKPGRNVLRFSLGETFLAVITQILGEASLWQHVARSKHNIIQDCVELSTP